MRLWRVRERLLSPIKEKSCYLQPFYTYRGSSIFNFIRQGSSSLLVKTKLSRIESPILQCFSVNSFFFSFWFNCMVKRVSFFRKKSRRTHTHSLTHTHMYLYIYTISWLPLASTSTLLTISPVFFIYHW